MERAVARRRRTSVIHQRRCDRLGDVALAHLLHAAPSGHAVDLEHGRRAVGAHKHVDAGDFGADRFRRCNRETLHLGIRRDGQGLAALLDVGDPCRGAAHHRGDHATAQDEQPIIREVLGSVRLKPLQIINPRDLFGAGQVFRPSNQAQALPLRAEQGFQHKRAARRFSFDEGARGFCRFHRPGRRRRNAGAREQKACHRLVDAAFDSARVVPDDDAKFRQRVQDAQAFGDRLK